MNQRVSSDMHLRPNRPTIQRLGRIFLASAENIEVDLKFSKAQSERLVLAHDGKNVVNCAEHHHHERSCHPDEKQPHQRRSENSHQRVHTGILDCAVRNRKGTIGPPSPNHFRTPDANACLVPRPGRDRGYSRGGGHAGDPEQ